MTSQESPPKMRDLQLPISRVKTIMKSSPNVESIGQDGLHLVVKATELFIHHFAKEAFSQHQAQTPNITTNSLDYKQLAEVVQTDDTLEFLREIMPRKITVRQFKEMMARKSVENSSDSESDSQSDSASGSESDDEDEDEEEHAKNGNSSGSENENNKENGKAESSGKSESSSSSESEN